MFTNKKFLAFLTVVMATLMLSFTVIDASTSVEKSFVPVSFDLSQEETYQWQNITNGQNIAVQNGSMNRIRTQNRNHIMLQVNQSAQICVNESTENPAGPLLAQTRSMTRFMSIELNQTRTMNATMFHNFTNYDLVDCNVYSYSWAFFNETSYQWQYVNSWVVNNPNGAALFCNTDHFSVWTILAPEQGPNPNIPFECVNATTYQLQNGSRYQLQSSSGFEIQFQFSANVSVTITDTDEAPFQVNNQFRNRVQTKFMNVSVNAEQYQVNATLAKDLKVQEGDMNKYKFAYYDEVKEDWETPENQWNVGTKLYCNTTHFSVWTIVEEESSGVPGFEIDVILMAITPIAIFSLIKTKKE